MLLQAILFFDSATLIILTIKASTVSLASHELVHWKRVPVIFQVQRLRDTLLVTLTLCRLEKIFCLTISP